MTALKSKIACVTIILMSIMTLSACHQDPQKEAEECVKDFIQALWNDDDSKGDALCVVVPTESGPVSAYRLAKSLQTKIDPSEIKIVVSFQEITIGKNQIVVIAEYKNQPIWFLVQFYNDVELPYADDINEKLYTKDKPRILSTMGLYEFDNNDFEKKHGFSIQTREDSYPNQYSCYSDDMMPYLLKDKLVKKASLLTAYLKNRNDSIRIINGSCGTHCLGGSLWDGILNEHEFRFECSDDSAHWVQYGDVIRRSYPLKQE